MSIWRNLTYCKSVIIGCQRLHPFRIKCRQIFFGQKSAVLFHKPVNLVCQSAPVKFFCIRFGNSPQCPCMTRQPQQFTHFKRPSIRSKRFKPAVYLREFFSSFSASLKGSLPSFSYTRLNRISIFRIPNRRRH